MESTTGEIEKKLLAATVQERLIGKKNSVLYKELLEEKIPTFLKNYLQNAVRKLINTEEPVQFKFSKRFDFEYQKIKQLRNSLSKAIEEATVFPREELVEIINKTVSLQFDLLVRPNFTLQKIFYNNKSDCVRGEILQILEGLEDNRIFIKALIRKIREFDQYHIVEEDFKKILLETEREIFQNHFISAFISEVTNFTEFLGMIRGYDNQKIKVELVKLLLLERKLDKYITAFDYYNGETIDIDGIISILEDYIKIENNDHQKTDSDEIDNFLMFSIPEEEKGSHGLKTIDNKLTESSIKFVESKEKVSPKNRKNKVIKVTNMYEDPLDRIIKRSQIEKQPDGPIESLKKIIDEKNEKFLIKRIFKNEKAEYHEFIEHLEQIESWKEAKEIIDRELNIREIKPFSKEALRLGDLVFTRYFPEKHY